MPLLCGHSVRRSDGSIERRDDFISKQIQTPTPVLAIIPIVGDGDQRAEATDLLAEFQELVSYRIWVARDDHFIHEVI